MRPKLETQPKLENRIAEVRKEHGLSAAELARRLGISPAEMSRLETGRTRLTHQWLLRIAEAIPCGPWELLAEWGEQSRVQHIHSLLAQLDETTRLGLITKLNKRAMPLPIADAVTLPSIIVMAPTETKEPMKVLEAKVSQDGYTVQIFAAARAAAKSPASESKKSALPKASEKF